MSIAAKREIQQHTKQNYRKKRKKNVSEKFEKLKENVEKKKLEEKN
jgi:hypothetical protein